MFGNFFLLHVFSLGTVDLKICLSQFWWCLFFCISDWFAVMYNLANTVFVLLSYHKGCDIVLVWDVHFLNVFQTLLGCNKVNDKSGWG